MRFGVRTGNRFKHTHTKSFSLVAAALFLPADVYFVFQRGWGTVECQEVITERVGGGGNISDHNTGTWPLGELLLYKIKPLLATGADSAALLQWLWSNPWNWSSSNSSQTSLTEEFATQTVFKTRISPVFISYCLLLWCRWGYFGPSDLFPICRLKQHLACLSVE